jgi:hypothetical protein
MRPDGVQLAEAANRLLWQLAKTRGLSPANRDPIDVASLELPQLEQLVQELTSTNPKPSKELASLLGESRVCLQLVGGFLVATRNLSPLPAVVRFEVPGRAGSAIPVVMPLASITAMIRDAKRLAVALESLERTQQDLDSR